jgi:tetratricopeptide (TPR) repeat protein
MKTILRVAMILALCAPLFAQVANPRPKSQKEADALMAIQDATDPDVRIEAIHSLLTGFKNTQFKEYANLMMMISYQQKDDFEMMLLYGESTLEINPNNIDTLLSLGYAIPARTGQFDLDKEEKLAKAEDFAKRALLVIPTLENTNEDVTPEAWLVAKKNYMSQAHDSRGLVAMQRKDYAAAEGSFRQSLQVASEQGATTFYHLARTLRELDKNDEAMEMIDKAIAAGGVMTGSGQDLAKIVKAQLIKTKAAAMMKKSRPAATPAAPVVAPVAAPVAAAASATEAEAEAVKQP